MIQLLVKGRLMYVYISGQRFMIFDLSDETGLLPVVFGFMSVPRPT